MIAFLLYFLVPLAWLFVSATKTNSELFSSFGLWFSSGFHLATNVSALLRFQGGIYWRWLVNTFLYSAASAVGGSLLAAAGGYAFARYQFRGRGLLFGTVLGAIMVPSTVLVIPTYLLFSKAGLTDTPFAVILPTLANPFGLYLMRVYAGQSVPAELLDAARIDGAGRDLEQLLPAAGHAEQPWVLPGDRGACQHERPGQRGRGRTAAGNCRDHWGTDSHRAADSGFPFPAALLAWRARHRQPPVAGGR
jgi:ABC-type sugar transport system permease subunit